MDALDQSGVDQVLLAADGTPTKSKLGARCSAFRWRLPAPSADTVGLPLWRYFWAEPLPRAPPRHS